MRKVASSINLISELSENNRRSLVVRRGGLTRDDTRRRFAVGPAFLNRVPQVSGFWRPGMEADWQGLYLGRLSPQHRYEEPIRPKRPGE